MKTTKAPEFPKLRTLFEELMQQAWPKVGGRRGRYKNGDLARIFERSVQHASYIRGGHRAPNEEQRTALADAMYGPKPSSARTDFLARLNAACEDRAPEQTGDFLEDLASGMPLKISSFDFPPFSGGPDCVFEALGDRLLGLCGIKQDLEPLRARLDLSSCTDQHLLMAVFDSPGRMLHLKFSKIPIRMSLGAVIMERHKNRLEAVASALTDPNSRYHSIVRPIVLSESVGAIHCQKRLRYREVELVSDPLEA